MSIATHKPEFVAPSGATCNSMLQKHIALRWSASTTGQELYKHGAPPEHLQPKQSSKSTFRAKLDENKVKTEARKSRAISEEVEANSGNVFADLGFQDAEERLLKAKLATKIALFIEEKGWTQAQTAEPKVDLFLTTLDV